MFVLVSAALADAAAAAATDDDDDDDDDEILKSLNLFRLVLAFEVPISKRTLFHCLF